MGGLEKRGPELLFERIFGDGLHLLFSGAGMHLSIIEIIKNVESSAGVVRACDLAPG